MREILDCMLEELIAIASRDNPSPLQKKEASRNFLNAITDTEKRALHYLKENLPADGHGQILISKAVAETGISRTAYTNLFNKMIKYNVADVNNGGVKGTNIYVYVKSILK
jgi:GTP-sensing pleiotropic transcriptional regulator CodY